MANNVPKTIEEFKAYVRGNNVPLEKIHMHLDEDYYGAKAFGIYRDGDEVIVYKNKADGSRAIHYQGPDEAYAVSELYLKMREMEMAAKDAKEPRNPLPASTGYTTGYKYYQQYNPAYDYEKKKKFYDSMHDMIFIVVLFALVGLIAHASNNSKPSFRSGYYYYNNAYYYNTGYVWFCYDSGNEKWEYVADSKVKGIVANYDAYATSISGRQVKPYNDSSSSSGQNESSRQNDRHSNSSDQDERYSESYDRDDYWDDDDDDDWSYDWDDDDDDWDYDYDNDWDWDSDW